MHANLSLPPINPDDMHLPDVKPELAAEILKQKKMRTREEAQEHANDDYELFDQSNDGKQEPDRCAIL